MVEMIELFKKFTLDKGSKTALHIQLYRKLKRLIEDGILLPDFRLPSVRRLSAILDVNPVTVVTAYKNLENEGLIYSKAGSGTYVANIPYSPYNRKIKSNNPLPDELYFHDDITLINNGQIKVNENTIDFASATPAPDLFPVEDFKVVLNDVLERDKGNAFSYQDSQGYFPIRESIARILHNYKIECNPCNIQLISGGQQGINIISN